MRNRLACLLCAVLAVPLWAGSASAALGGSKGFTLVVVPSRYSVIQVAMDVLAKRSVVLLAYQGEASTPDPVLHAWNGEEWVRISLKDFREASFLQEMPREMVLVGDDKTLPAVIREAAGWCALKTTVTDLTTGSLVNELGRVFKWRKSEWEWFAKRYNLSLVDESEPYRKSSWYDQPGPLLRAGKGGTSSDTTISIPPVSIDPAAAGASKPAPQEVP
jgi:hypothetical protein